MTRSHVIIDDGARHEEAPVSGCAVCHLPADIAVRLPICRGESLKLGATKTDRRRWCGGLPGSGPRASKLRKANRAFWDDRNDPRLVLALRRGQKLGLVVVNGEPRLVPCAPDGTIRMSTDDIRRIWRIKDDPTVINLLR